MRRDIIIGYITVDDPRDRRSWSGTNFFLLRALEATGCHVVSLGPLRPQPVLFFCRVFNFFTTRLLGKRFHYRDSFILSRAYARLLRKRIARERPDLIIAPAGRGTTALLRAQQPIVYFNDRCIAGALDYHEILSGLFAFSREQSLALERKALANASLSVFGSSWASEAARLANPATANKVRMIPLGANLETVPVAPSTRDFPPKTIKLLFMGVNWRDKGGPIAYKTLMELKRRGQPTQLVVCGCTPPPECDDVDLVREGFLNKNVVADRIRLEDHLRTADFLIVPTRFEAYGIVFCEAAAYGIPVLATRTGGVPTIVEEGRTGYLFDMSDDGDVYADRVMRIIAEPQHWQEMRTNARKRYEEVLNWEAFVKSLFDQISEAGLIKSSR